MMKIIDRIIVFIKYKNLSMRKFDIAIGVGNGYTSKQAKSGASVGSHVLQKIIGTFPDLSPASLQPAIISKVFFKPVPTIIPSAVEILASFHPQIADFD